MRTSGAHWTGEQKFVSAAHSMWSEIIKVMTTTSSRMHIRAYVYIIIAYLSYSQKNPLAAAYYYRDDPKFTQLAIVFGLEDVKQEEVQMVIVISDSSLAGNPVSVHYATPSEDPVEVNSPVFADVSKVRRKLFIDEESSDDCESSNAKSLCRLS